MAANQNALEQILAALTGGGGGRRVELAGDLPGPTPIQAPAASAGTADALLARALSGPAPANYGAGIHTGLTAIGAGLASRSKRQQTEADQAQQTKAAGDMLAQLTAGAPGTLNAGELPSVPSAADAEADPKAAAALMGLDRPAGEMTTGARAPTYDPGDPMAMLAKTLIDQGQGAKVPGFFAADLTAKAAAKAKADALRQGMQFDLLKQANQANLRATTPKSPEVVAQETAINAARAGFERGPGGNLRPIPGGPQDPATVAATAEATAGAKAKVKKETAFPKAQTALQGFERQGKVVSDTVDEALGLISPWSTGYGAFLADMPETDAGKLRNALDTLKANVGFDKLQQMRDNSPTGGALGQVSEFENRLLQAVNGALDPKQSDQLGANLTKIKTLYGQVMEERRGAFQQDYGGMMPKEEAKPGGGGAAGDGLPDGTIIDSPDPSKPSLIRRGGQWVPADG